jgi:hypothetical protein
MIGATVRSVRSARARMRLARDRTIGESCRSRRPALACLRAPMQPGREVVQNLAKVGVVGSNPTPAPFGLTFAIPVLVPLGPGGFANLNDNENHLRATGRPPDRQPWRRSGSFPQRFPWRINYWKGIGDGLLGLLTASFRPVTAGIRGRTRGNAAGELGDVVGDHGTLRMEPLRVGGEPWGIRRMREASTSRAVATSSGVTADCPPIPASTCHPWGHARIPSSVRP